MGSWGWDDLLGIPTGGIYTAAKHAVVPGAESLYNNLYKGPADAKKAGLDQLSAGLNQLADKQQAFQLEGMNKALGKYDRANAINQSLYGNPGSLSVAPVNTGNFKAR